MAAYDPRRSLIIDPVLSYSTYLGGSNHEDTFGIAVDAAGNAYVAGYTYSADFPTTPDAFQPMFQGDIDAFIAKLTPDGTALVYATYLGGTYGDFSLQIAVDAAENAYVTGNTWSDNFPTTPGAFQPAHRGGTDVFVTKLNAAGSAFLYSTYLGGISFDYGEGIVVDTAGNAYVTGDTVSADFPTTPGAFQRTLGGWRDAFVTKLNAVGSALLYSTFLGGRSDDIGRGIAVDTEGNIYVTGLTASADFPTTPGAFQPNLGGGDDDAFIAKLAGAPHCQRSGPHRIWGRVQAPGSEGPRSLPDVTLTLSGPGECQDRVVTGPRGAYEFPQLAEGTYRLTPRGGSSAGSRPR